MDFWNNNHPLTPLYEELAKKMPHMGSPKGKAMAALCKASNHYYDVFNNGLCNRAKTFRGAFPDVSVKEARTIKVGDSAHRLMDNRLCVLILAAAYEQKLDISEYLGQNKVSTAPQNN